MVHPCDVKGMPGTNQNVTSHNVRLHDVFGVCLI